MGEDQGDGRQELAGEPPQTPEQVRAEIEQTRAELGDTVAALAEKADVKRQAKQALTGAKTTVSEKVAEAKQTVTGKQEEFVSSTREATPDSAVDARRRLGTLVRSNPVPVTAFIAFAVGVKIGRSSAS